MSLHWLTRVGGKIAARAQENISDINHCFILPISAPRYTCRWKSEPHLTGWQTLRSTPQPPKQHQQHRNFTTRCLVLFLGLWSHSSARQSCLHFFTHFINNQDKAYVIKTLCQKRDKLHCSLCFVLLWTLIQQLILFDKLPIVMHTWRFWQFTVSKRKQSWQ